MNIWCISKYACPPKYGAAARLFYLAREFSRHGNQALLITSDSNHLARYPQTNLRYNNETIDGVRICWIKTKKYKRTASIARILSWLDFERGLFFMPRRKLSRPDVLIVSSLSLLSIVYGYYLKKYYRAFLVFEVRDIWPLTMMAEGGFSRWHPLSILLGMVEKFGYKKADLIVGTMPKLNLHVQKTLGYDRPFLCSPLGYSKERICDDTLSHTSKLYSYFPKNKIIIGYAGSMGITNALEPFIHCIESLKEREDIHFVLVGSGDLRDVYCSRLSDNTNVTFVPRINQNEVPCFLKLCDILYLSTHDSTVWEFGQSMNKFVEYMMAGKPIIASYSGYQSMLNEADAGMFVPANDSDALKQAIIQFVGMSNDKRHEIGEKGRKWLLDNRSYATLAQEYLNTIKSMMS